jgi:hypothetical protein
MQLDPEERVMPEFSDEDVHRVAAALATEEFSGMAWGELPGVEQQRLTKKARVFLRAWKAAAIGGINPN